MPEQDPAPVGLGVPDDDDEPSSAELPDEELSAAVGLPLLLEAGSLVEEPSVPPDEPSSPHPEAMIKTASHPQRFMPKTLRQRESSVDGLLGARDSRVDTHAPRIESSSTRC